MSSLVNTDQRWASLQNKVSIIYSSLTGNTQQVAEALAQFFHFPLFPVEADLDLSCYRILILGFWVKRGLPDSSMLALMERIFHKQIFFFATHAAWPDSEHMQKCRAKVQTLLEKNGNCVLGYFTCQGRIRPSKSGEIISHHPLTAERLRRLEEASHHPNETDFLRARVCLEQALLKV